MELAEVVTEREGVVDLVIEAEDETDELTVVLTLTEADVDSE